MVPHAKIQKGMVVAGFSQTAKTIPPKNGTNNLSNGNGRQGFKVNLFPLNQENRKR